MSYSVTYNSFDEITADEKWNNFDVNVNDKTLANIDEITELNDKELHLDPYDLPADLIYKPELQEEYKKKFAEVVEQKSRMQEEIKKLEESNLDSGIFYYIKKQEPIEVENVIPTMIGLDLVFGGHSVSFPSWENYIGRPENALRIMFSGLSRTEYDGGLNQKDLKIVGENLKDVASKFNENTKLFIEKMDLESQDQEGVDCLKEEVTDYLTTMLPIIRNVVKNKARVFYWSDSEDFPKDIILEARARKHIGQFKEHPLLKVPLQNFKS